jgi:hypothetical protein
MFGDTVRPVKELLPFVLPHHHYLKGLSLFLLSGSKPEASLRIMGNSPLLEQVTSLMQHPVPQDLTDL